MLRAEYVKNLNCNYERVLLEEKPEENRYQYCIVTRGGMKGILPCSLRYINGEAYLYYDISSTQSVEQLYLNRKIDRQWIKDFLWSMGRINQEMDRFLLDNSNLLWFPDQIFQDLEQREFFFLYVPYYEGNTGFNQLLEYLIEHIDYNDEKLAECVYKMHEQYMNLGEAYLKEQIYEDGKQLEQESVALPNIGQSILEQSGEVEEIQESKNVNEISGSRRGIRYFFEEKWRKPKEEREFVYRASGQSAEFTAVCEDGAFEKNHMANKQGEDFVSEKDINEEEEIGKTIYMEVDLKEKKTVPGLYTAEGKMVASLDKQSLILGKKKDEVDCVLEDVTISRMHARISAQKDGVYLEDLNSTNGTSKNGLRLQPYEKRRLDSGDEIKMGKTILYFR